MPEYTMHCPKCGEQFERFAWRQEDLDEVKRACPRCGNTATALRWVIELAWENLANFGCA